MRGGRSGRSVDASGLGGVSRRKGLRPRRSAKSDSRWSRRALRSTAWSSGSAEWLAGAPGIGEGRQ
jgi:hypothetical protein